MSSPARLRAVLSYSRYSAAEFARKCEIPYDSFVSAITERRHCNLTIVAGIITHFPEINPRWLVIGRGEMLSEGVRAAIQRERQSSGLHDQ